MHVQQMTCIANNSRQTKLMMRTRDLHVSDLRDLLVKNDELNARLKYDMDKLNHLVSKQMSVAESGNESTNELQQLQLTGQVKQTELFQVQEEMAVLRYSLNIKQVEGV